MAAEEARSLYKKAELESDIPSKQVLFTQAAKLFLAAADEMRELSSVTHVSPNLIASLVHLSAAAIKKANTFQELINTRLLSKPLSAHEIKRLMKQNLSMTDSSADLDVSVYNGRLLSSARLKSRISGVSKIPRAMASTSAGVVNDVLILESKLAELGILRPNNSLNQSFVSVDGAGNISNIRNRSQASALGESFMLLNANQRQSSVTSDRKPLDLQNPVMGIAKANNPALNQMLQQEPLSPLSAYRKQRERVAVAVAYNQHAAPGPLDISPQQYGIAVDTQKSSDRSSETSSSKDREGSAAGSWASSVLGWLASPPQATSVAPPVVIDASKNTTSSAGRNDSRQPFSVGGTLRDSVQDSIRWDMGGGLNSSIIPVGGLSNSHIDSKEDLSTLGGNKSVSEGVFRLLQTVKRLGDENSMLLKKIESFANVDQQNAAFRKEMVDFKDEYKSKLAVLKEALRNFAIKYPSKENPASIVFGSPTAAAVDTSGSRLHAQPINSTIDDETLARSLARADLSFAQPLASATASAPDNQRSAVGGTADRNRQLQLEKTVDALVERLETMKIDIEKKDKKLKKYEDYYKLAKAKKNASAAGVQSEGTASPGGPEIPSLSLNLPVKVGGGSISAGNAYIPGMTAASPRVVSRPISSAAKAEALQRNHALAAQQQRSKVPPSSPSQC